MKYILYALLGLCIIFGGSLLLQRYVSSGPLVTDHKLSLVASFYPMGFFAQRIGGDYVHVVTMTPAGAEPHDYEPTTQDIRLIMQSQLLILNGGSLEAWGDKIRDELAGTKTQIVIAGNGLTTNHIEENGQSITDPHIWLDPVLAKKEVTRIANGIIAADPRHQSYYIAHEQALIAQLDALNSAYATGLSHCEQTSFVTSHAAFGYLASQYGLTQIAISGVSPDEEPSSQTLANITTIVKEKHIHAIFFESLVSPKLSDTIAMETGAQTLVLDPLEGLTKEEVAQGLDYFSVQKRNLSNLQKALVCHP